MHSIGYGHQLNAHSPPRYSQAVPQPSAERALCRLISEVPSRRVHSTQYGCQNRDRHGNMAIDAMSPPKRAAVTENAWPSPWSCTCSGVEDDVEVHVHIDVRGKQGATTLPTILDGFCPCLRPSPRTIRPVSGLEQVPCELREGERLAASDIARCLSLAPVSLAAEFTSA